MRLSYFYLFLTLFLYHTSFLIAQNQEAQIWKGAPIPPDVAIKTNGTANLDFTPCVPTFGGELCNESNIDTWIEQQVERHIVYKKKYTRQGKTGHYYGPMKENKPHGYGIFLYESGDWYKGRYQDGQRAGYGISFWKKKQQKQIRKYEAGKLVWKNKVMPAFNAEKVYLSEKQKDFKRHLNQLLNNSPDLIAPSTIKAFYSKRAYEAYWIEHPKKAKAFLKYLPQIYQEGINPENYHLESLNNLWEEDAKGLTFEILLTDAWLSLAKDYWNGQVDIARIDSSWHALSGKLHADRYLAKTIDNKKNTLKALQSLLPQHSQYQELKKQLTYFFQLTQNEDWPLLPSQKILKKGQENAQIAALAKRLKQLRFFRGRIDSTLLFDETLETAVKAFQAANHLTADAIVGPKTIDFLNRPLNYYLTQIALNMERWRWMSDDFTEEAYVWVNIPAYELQILENQKVIYDTKVIVGKRSYRTPIFSDEITYVEFNPTWRIPNSIVNEEILPELHKDLNYLSKKNIAVFQGAVKPENLVNPNAIDWQNMQQNRLYEFVQRSGGDNPLGQVKLMFPNPYNIYIHDTPAKYLFDKKERIFSHGCLRAQNPLQLADFILNKQLTSWQAAQKDSLLALPNKTRVELTQKLPVHIVYFTAYVNSRGQLILLDDIYEKDRLLEEALF